MMSGTFFIVIIFGNTWRINNLKVDSVITDYYMETDYMLALSLAYIGHCFCHYLTKNAPRNLSKCTEKLI